MKIAMLVVLLLYTQISFAISGGKKLYNTKTAQDSIKLTHTFQELDSLIEQNKTKDKIAFASNIKEYIHLCESNKEYIRAYDKIYDVFKNILEKKYLEKDSLNLIVDKLLSYKSFIKDSSKIGNLLWVKAGPDFYDGNFIEVIKAFSEMLPYFNKSNINRLGEIHFYRGLCYYMVDDFLKARADYQQARDYYQESNDLKGYVSILGNLANVYSTIGLNEKALEIRKNQIELMLANNFTDGLATSYNVLGEIYGELKNKKEHEKYILKALEIVKAKESKNFLIAQYLRTAVFYAETDLVKANYYFNLSEKIPKPINYKETYWMRYHKLEYYVKNQQYLKAIEIGNLLMKEVSEKKMASWVAATSGELSKAHEGLNNFKKSLEYKKTNYRIRDSIANIKNNNLFSYYENLYEAEKREREIDQQKGEINLLNNKNEYQKRILFFGGILTVLFFTLILLLRKRAQLKKEKILQEQFSQQILSTQESERKRIAKDLHDSLGQNLMLLKNNISLTSDVKNGKLVDEAINEMRIISSMLHPYELIEQGLFESIQKLIHKLNDNYKELNIFMDVSKDIDKLEKEKVINFYRIIQEILSNAIKHSNAKYINVKITERKQQISLKVKDDGKGFDYAQKLSDVQTMGIRTIKERVKLLNGTLNLVTAVDQGTEFKIKVPL